MFFFSRLSKAIRSGQFFTRFVGGLNKSPLKRIMFGLRLLFSYRSYRHRVQLAKEIEVNEDIRDCLEELRVKGFTNASKIINRELLEQMSQEVQKVQFDITQDYKGNDASHNSTINPWVRLSDIFLDSNGKLDKNNFLVRFAVQESVVKVVSKFFGEIPRLDYAIVTKSFPVESSRPWYSSQNWHFDYDDRNVVKMFVYFNDVLDSEDGPFCLLDRSESKKVKNSFIHRHLSDTEIFKFANQSKVIEMKAPKLSCFLVNTSHCYHMGGRQISSNYRVLYTAAFATAPSIFPGLVSKFSSGKNENLGPLEKLIFNSY